MNFTGKVASKTVNAEGHSNVTLQGEFNTSAPKDGSKPMRGSIIISTPDVDVVEEFRVGQPVTFTL
jgi:hypothetical protein